MYNVSNAYKIAAMEPAQEHRLTGTIGSVSFDENNIVAGSFNIQKQSTDSNSMVLGSCYIGQLTATFTGINLARGAWLNKTIAPSFALKLADNSWETVPLGVYKIKEAVHTAEGVQVTAYDNMIKFDKKIKNKKTTLGFVTDSMYTFINLCCTKCNVTLGMTKAQIDALPNGYRAASDIEVYGDAKADDFANDIETYRDLLYWCAQTVGCFATIDRAGQLILKQYTQLIDETISDTVRLSGANFEDYVTHFTGILVTDMDTNDDTYYGYDADELLVQINETSEDLTEANEALTENQEEQIELERKHNAHEITDEEYATQKATLLAEEKEIRQLIKKLTKRLGWLEAELQDAQNDEEGAIMNLGANPFVQYKNLTKRDNTRRRILGAMSNISYTPFTASMVCGAHYDLGDIIQFTGGHSDNDICCVMSWSYTHNMGTELEGFGTDSAQQQVRVRNKAEKQADRANTTASTTGHTFVAEADPDTETGAPRSSKQGDIWVDINQDPPTPEPGDPGMTLIQVASTDVTDDWSASYSVNNDGTYNLVFTGNNTEYYTGKNLAAVFEITNAPANVDIDYTVSGDFTYTGTFASDDSIRGLGLAFNKQKSDFRWDDYDPGFHDDSNGKAHLQVAANSGTIHYTGTFDSTGDSSNKLYMMVGINGTRVIQQGVEGYGGGTLTIENFSITRPGVVPQPGPIIPGERTAGKMYANDNGEWREVKRITDISQSEAAGGPIWNGLEKDNDSEVISLKKNVVRAWYKADPPQTTRNFSQLCVRYTGEPDKFIDIEPYAAHTFEDKEVKSDDENAFYIKCGGVGGSGSYCAYKLTGLVAGARYYFNFAYNFSNNAEFGDDTTKGLGLVFNTTGTISTDDWNGAEDTFDEENLYYSMKRSITKHYADFSFMATATTMYMCVVTADETGGQDITLILNEFVIADSERKFIRNIYLYDYEKNVWLKYRPFGSVTGGGDDGGGSVVRIIPVLSQGTKIADYTIDGEPGALYAPEYTLPIASANTLGGIKVGQNLTINPTTGVLDATGGGDLDAVELTYAQYQALSPEQKADPNTIYFITDYPASVGALNDLTDVDITTPTEGQILTYDDTDDEWKNTDVDDVAPTVTEASTRANLASGDTLGVIIGKIKKWFSDLKDLAFTAIDGANSTKYLRGDGTWQSALELQGRVYGSGDDEGLVIKANTDTNWASMTLLNSTGRHSTIAMQGGNSTDPPFWRYNDGTTNFNVNHPAKTGTIALTSDLSSYLPRTGGTLQNSSNDTPLYIKTYGNYQGAYIGFKSSADVSWGYIGVKNDNLPYFYYNGSKRIALLSDIPSKTSDLTNDSNFVSSSYNGFTKRLSLDFWISGSMQGKWYTVLTKEYNYSPSQELIIHISNLNYSHSNGTSKMFIVHSHYRNLTIHPIGADPSFVSWMVDWRTTYDSSNIYLEFKVKTDIGASSANQFRISYITLTDNTSFTVPTSLVESSGRTVIDTYTLNENFRTLKPSDITSTYVPYSTGGTIVAFGAWADSYSNTEIAIRPKVNTKGTVGSSDYKFSRGYFVELSVGSSQSDTAPSGGNRSRGYIYLCNTSSDYSVYLSAPTATASRSITFPDAAGTVSVSGSSSIKTKKNVTDMTDEEAEKLLSLRPVNYDYKNEENGTDCYGLIAEEVQEAGIVYPVFTMHDDTLDEDVPALDYAKFVPYLIKMVQMQQKQIDAMQKQIDELMEIKK